MAVDMDASGAPADTMLDKKKTRQHKKRHSQVEERRLPVSINVYDLMPQSRLSTLMWFTGLSICHSGVVLNDQEWAFGGHDVEGISGVYVTKPKAVPENATFRSNIPIGITLLDDDDIRKHLDRLKSEYTGPSYDLLNKNCNHFVQDVCLALCGVKPPAWINRIAGLGAKLPLCVADTWVNPPVAELDGDDEDVALLLPPSEVAPMQRHLEAGSTVSEDESDEDSANDRYLTMASGGKRMPIGSR